MNDTKNRRKMSAKVREQRSEENARYYAKVKAARVAARLEEGFTAMGRMKVRADLKGNVYGKLTVGEYAETVGAVGARKAIWWVQCGCGSPAFKLRAEQLTRKYPRQHCGCGVVRKDRAELEGSVRGKLTVLRVEERPAASEALKGKEKYRVLWRCRCACGREVLLRSNQLKEEGGRTCCGCELKTINGHPRKIRGVEGVGYLARRAAGEVKEVRKGGARRSGAVDGEWPDAKARGMKLAEMATAVRTGRRTAETAEAERPKAGEMGAAGWMDLLVRMKDGGARWGDMEMELEAAGRKAVTREMVEARIKERAEMGR